MHLIPDTHHQQERMTTQAAVLPNSNTCMGRHPNRGKTVGGNVLEGRAFSVRPKDIDVKDMPDQTIACYIYGGGGGRFRKRSFQLSAVLSRSFVAH